MGLPANCYRLGDGETGTVLVHENTRLRAFDNEHFYRAYRIYYDPPPIPTRNCDYHYYHNDYGGEGDNRYGYAASVEECKREIDTLYDEA